MPSDDTAQTPCQKRGDSEDLVSGGAGRWQWLVVKHGGGSMLDAVGGWVCERESLMIRNGLEPWHLVIVFAVIMLVFGGKKLPELARGMGQGLRIFRSEMRADDVAVREPCEISGTSGSVGSESASAAGSDLASGRAAAQEPPTTT